MRVLDALRANLRAVFTPGATRPPARGVWAPVVREPYPGAWQQNAELITPDVALSNPTVFRCVSLIATDIGKLALNLVQVDANGIWRPAYSPAFTPVLRRPNAYQTIGQFKETWVLSRLLAGNVYVLKVRDDRGVVVQLHVLDPSRVKVLVAPDGAVYYELAVNELAGLPDTGAQVIMPARDVIHDRWNCAYHPLVGLSPLYACGGAASQGIAMQVTSTAFFSGGGQPSGMLVPENNVDQKTIDRLKATWTSMRQGETAILGFKAKYEPVTTSASDAQWEQQAGWTAKTIAGCFGVPISMVDSSQQPPYANAEASALQYHSQCLQTHLTAIETCLDAGLDLPYPYGTEFDLDDLIWMDTATKTKAAHDAISAGALSPNEARRKYFGLGPVPGGDTPYLQSQYYALEALATRDLAIPADPAPTAAVAPDPAPDPTEVPT